MRQHKYILTDDRTEEEVNKTIGFIIATDKFMSGWGDAPGKSVVAIPFVSCEDMEVVRERMERRAEMKRIRVVYNKNYRPRLYKGDHLHIYNTSTSFRYHIQYN